MIQYIKFGNIFKLQDVSAYAHGCNCAGAMGKGIALQFKEKYPQMYVDYKQLCKDNLFSLGDVFIYRSEYKTIFNLATQKTWKTKADLNAIEQAFVKMLLYASQNNINKIALPKIGAGLGGLDWDNVKYVIERTSKDYQ